jgi:uncharacterized protein YndB with AHSA1/START domain
MPMRIEAETVIPAPTGQVWAFISDPRNDPRWCPNVRSVEQVAGDGPGPGARYEVMHDPRPGAPPTRLEVEVAEFDPPRRLRLLERDDDAVFDVVLELTPEADGTRIVQRDEIDWSIPRIARPIAGLMVRRHLRQQFSELQRLLA